MYYDQGRTGISRGERERVNRQTLRILRDDLEENGAFSLAAKLIFGLRCRTRDRFLASKIGCSPLQIGRNPKLVGLRRISIGRGFVAGDHLWIEAVVKYRGISYDPHIVIGDGVQVSDFVHLGATTSIVIDDGVLIGSGVLIIDHNHGTYSGFPQCSPEAPPNERRLSSGTAVSIGTNVWIGDGVAVLPGARVGAGSVIGANSVVIGDIPPNCIAVGTPAIPVRRYDPEIAQWGPVRNL